MNELVIKFYLIINASLFTLSGDMLNVTKESSTRIIGQFVTQQGCENYLISLVQLELTPEQDKVFDSYECVSVEEYNQKPIIKEYDAWVEKVQAIEKRNK